MSASEILRERAAEWRRIATVDDPDPWDREDVERGERECLTLADLLEAIRVMAEGWDETGWVGEERARTVVDAALGLEAAITEGPQT